MKLAQSETLFSREMLYLVCNGISFISSCWVYAYMHIFVGHFAGYSTSVAVFMSVYTVPTPHWAPVGSGRCTLDWGWSFCYKVCVWWLMDQIWMQTGNANLSHALMLPILTWPLWLIVPPIHQYMGMQCPHCKPTGRYCEITTTQHLSKGQRPLSKYMT